MVCLLFCGVVEGVYAQGADVVVFDDVVVVFRAHDACGIEVFEFVFHECGEVWREDGGLLVGDFLFKLGYLCFACCGVDGEVGFVEFGDAVFFALYRFVAFVDGEIVGGYQLAVAPGSAELKLIELAFFARHEEADDEQECNGNEQPVDLGFCAQGAWLIISVHWFLRHHFCFIGHFSSFFGCFSRDV